MTSWPFLRRTKGRKEESVKWYRSPSVVCWYEPGESDLLEDKTLFHHLTDTRIDSLLFDRVRFASDRTSNTGKRVAVYIYVWSWEKKSSKECMMDGIWCVACWVMPPDNDPLRQRPTYWIGIRLDSPPRPKALTPIRVCVLKGPSIVLSSGRSMTFPSFESTDYLSACLSENQCVFLPAKLSLLLSAAPLAVFVFSFIRLNKLILEERGLI